ncbi:unnamed protein product [Arctia plantaginis]|uniref:Uncharacterized protein n=1 Tax=Arctia plantaginis TaxID=874455 RepID=A0A8S0ZJM3_ARCPL|nr:unnamed protein product [Arctia plantaginis]
MASPKHHVSCSAVASDESSVVQVLDSNEPLVASSSSGPLCSVMPSVESSVVQVLDSDEPLVASSSAGPSCVQVLDSSEPLVPMTVPSEPVAGSSRATNHGTVSVLSPASPTSSESSVGDAEPRASGSSGRRFHYYSEEIRSHWNMFRIYTQLNTKALCIAFAEERRLLPTEKMCNYHRRPMILDSSSRCGLGVFRCRKSNCRVRAKDYPKPTIRKPTGDSIRILSQRRDSLQSL